MEKETKNSTYQYPSTLDELIDDRQNHPEKYKHLQIIFGSKIDHYWGLGQKYLVVNQIGFGLYQLNSVDYSNGILQMVFTNPATGNPVKINLNVCNEHPELYLIKWKDVEDMVNAERTFDYTDDELLELEND